MKYNFEQVGLEDCFANLRIHINELAIGLLLRMWLLTASLAMAL